MNINARAVEAAAEAMYEIEWSNMLYENQPEPIKKAWRDLASAGLLAAARTDD